MSDLKHAPDLAQKYGRISGTINYHQKAPGFLYTDGVAEICNGENMWWLLDEIVSGILHVGDGPAWRMWRVKVNGQAAVMLCETCDSEILYTKQITHTDARDGYANLLSVINYHNERMVWVICLAKED